MKEKLNKWWTMICLILVLPATLHAQTESFRHIKSRTYISGSDYLEETHYFDGLGRQLQTTRHKITPTGKGDLLLQETDARGKLRAQWLPYSHATAAAPGYMTPEQVKQGAIAAHKDENPHTLYTYEASPLGRLTAAYGEGKEWHSGGYGRKLAYLTNIAGNDTLNCVIYKATDPNISTVTLTKGANYASGQLSVVREENETGNVTFTFTDKKDQVILTRQRLTSGSNLVNVDTYYVYDDFGQLRAVLPPMAIDEQLSAAALAGYAYLYKYDVKGRLLGKRLPGCGWNWYIYDQADQLIFSQNPEQRLRGEWSFTIPDVLGRTVLTGICKNSITINGGDPYKDKLISAMWSKQTNAYKGYTIQGVSITSPVVLAVNYYDNYEFMGLNGIPAYTDDNFKPEVITGGERHYIEGHAGLHTGVWMAKIEGTSASGSLYKVMYYNEKGRLLQLKANNHLPGGIEKEFFKYNPFTGLLTRYERRHAATGKSTQTEVYDYTYDRAGRLTRKTHQLNSLAEVVLEENTYDEQGRLTSTSTASQEKLKRTYSYNLRSWLTQLQSYHFWQRMTYNRDGNIRTMNWGQASKNRTYTYTYDELSRLRTAAFSGDGDYRTAYTYDKQGNILTLLRYGNLSATSHGVIDNLMFTYRSNQLRNIIDSGPNVTYNGTNDFKDYSKSTASEYLYDDNGAMKYDLNKGISSIQYNYLHLPHIIDLKNPVAEARNMYTYAADGTKLSVKHAWNPSPSSTAVTGTAVNVSALTSSKITDYVGNKVYENGTLKRILVEGGYYDVAAQKYQFYIQDYLGSNRIVSDANGTSKQYTQYYPFGAAFGENSGTETQPYKYTGQELDTDRGLNLYDYHARQYDPAVGRFLSMDPLAEKYYSTSPYAYCGNNPITRIDPTGMDWWTTNNMDEVERILMTLKTGGEINTSSFGEEWTHVTDQELADGVGIFDDASLGFTVNGESWENAGYGMKDGIGTFGVGLNFDYNNPFHYIGPAVGLSSLPIKMLKPIGALSSRSGSSILSYTLSKAAPIKMGKTGSKISYLLTARHTTNFGRFVGRAAGPPAWLATALDIQYNFVAVPNMNQIKYNIQTGKNPLDGTLNPTTGEYYIPGSFNWLRK